MKISPFNKPGPASETGDYANITKVRVPHIKLLKSMVHVQALNLKIERISSKNNYSGKQRCAGDNMKGLLGRTGGVLEMKFELLVFKVVSSLRVVKDFLFFLIKYTILNLCYKYPCT